MKEQILTLYGAMSSYSDLVNKDMIFLWGGGGAVREGREEELI